MKNKEFYCNIKISIHKENYSLSKLKTCYEKQQQHLREWIYWQVIFLEKCLYSGYKKSYNPINIWGEDLHINFTKEEISMANEHIERYSMSLTFQFSSVAQSCWLFETPWIAARQASLSITNSQSSPRFTSIESVMPSSHLILCRPLLLLPPIPPSIRVFPNESTLRMRWPKYWSFNFSIIPPKKSQGWSPSEWTGWISLQSKGLSRVFFNTTVQKHQFFGAQPSSHSNSHTHTWPQEKP